MRLLWQWQWIQNQKTQVQVVTLQSLVLWPWGGGEQIFIEHLLCADTILYREDTSDQDNPCLKRPTAYRKASPWVSVSSPKWQIGGADRALWNPTTGIKSNCAELTLWRKYMMWLRTKQQRTRSKKSLFSQPSFPHMHVWVMGLHAELPITLSAKA